MYIHVSLNIHMLILIKFNYKPVSMSSYIIYLNPQKDCFGWIHRGILTIKRINKNYTFWL